MIQIYLRRIVSVIALALVTVAITQPVSATGVEPNLDPVTKAVAGAVDTATAELSGTVETTTAEVSDAVEPAPKAPAPKDAVGSVTEAVSIPATSGVTTGAVDVADPSSTVSGTTTSDGTSRSTAARRGDRSRGSGSTLTSQGSGGDDRDELLAAGNDVMTTLTMGTVQRKAPPSKPKGAPLALTGTSILMGLIAGLVLMAVGVGTETAARRSGTAVA